MKLTEDNRSSFPPRFWKKKKKKMEQSQKRLLICLKNFLATFFLILSLSGTAALDDEGNRIFITLIGKISK